MARIDAFFKLMAEQKASDLHLSTSNPPMLRINGDLIRVDYPPLTNDELQSMVYEIAPEMKIKVFEETGDVDFGYEIPGVAGGRHPEKHQQKQNAGGGPSKPQPEVRHRGRLPAHPEQGAHL